MGRTTARQRGVTLLEMMVAGIILLLVMGILLSVTEQTHRASRYASSKIEAFQNARVAFDSVARSLGVATLNTYYDYYDANRNRRTPANASNFEPSAYGRYSDLEFVCGKNLVQTPRPQVTHAVFFQSTASYTQERSAYAEVQGLLNATGFYIEFYNDTVSKPSFMQQPNRWRFRLMQLLQPTEGLAVYSSTAAHAWFTAPIASGTAAPVRLVAENIICLAVCPRLPADTEGSSLSADYEYDTDIAAATPAMQWAPGAAQPAAMNQLPPVIRIAMIAVDERSMARIQGSSSTPPDLGFDYAKVFQKSSALKTDLATIGAALAARHIDYRIFQTDVAVRGAKWSP